MPLTFSQRKGLKLIKSKIQIDSMDDDLRRGLWNSLFKYYLSKVDYAVSDYGEEMILHMDEGIRELKSKIWFVYFNNTLDVPPPTSWELFFSTMKNYFFKNTWYEAYDFIEFVSNHFPNATVNSDFMKACNETLEKELSAYRFMGGRIVEVTTQEDISEIEQALEAPIKPTQEHLKNSLDKLADRKNPDYRNSIKESISAVESLCKIISKKKKAELKDALVEIESKLKLHGSLTSAFTKLYGYASDADGIRHALLDEPNISFEDAKFMLVACSAFINYLITKASKAGIEI